MAETITNWIRNAEWISDPTHGEFTRERYLKKWAKVISAKEHWIDRDKGPIENIGIDIPCRVSSGLHILGDFLGVDREVLAVGILASEALEHCDRSAPEWNDMTMLQASQSAKAV